MTDLKQETERLLGLDIPQHIKIIFGDHEKHMAALQAENDRLQAECEALRALAADAYEAWEYDKDSRVGKLLMAMRNPEFRASYRPDLAAMNRERGE